MTQIEATTMTADEILDAMQPISAAMIRLGEKIAKANPDPDKEALTENEILRDHLVSCLADNHFSQAWSIACFLRRVNG